MTVAPGLPAPPFPSRDLPTEVVLASLGLSTQDQLFVTLYRQTGDAMASCVRAKMSDPAWPTDVLAMKTLERPGIQRAIELLDRNEREAAEARQQTKQQIALRSPAPEITKDVIMADLQNVFELAMGNGPATDVDEKGNPVAPKPNLGAAIASKKIQASVLGILRSTVDVNFHMKRAEDMSDAELERIAKQGKTIDAQYTDVTGDDE